MPDSEPNALVLSHQIGSLGKQVEEGFRGVHKRLDGMDQRVESLERWRIETETEERVTSRLSQQQAALVVQQRSWSFTRAQLLVALLGALGTIGSVIAIVH